MSHQPNNDPLIFLNTQGHFYCNKCTPDGVENDKLMNICSLLIHGLASHRILDVNDLGAFVHASGFVEDWEIEKRKSAKRPFSDLQAKKVQSEKIDNYDASDGEPSNSAAALSRSRVLNQHLHTTGTSGFIPATSFAPATSGPSHSHPSSNISTAIPQIPANFPYIICDKCRGKNQECHLDVVNQYCAECYCVGRKCYVNGVSTKEIWKNYIAQNPGVKAAWVVPNYTTPIPDRQRRKKVAAGKKAEKDAVTGSIAI